MHSSSGREQVYVRSGSLASGVPHSNPLVVIGHAEAPVASSTTISARERAKESSVGIGWFAPYAAVAEINNASFASEVFSAK